MINKRNWASAGAVCLGVVGLGLAWGSGPDGPPDKPRPGLSSQQTKAAVTLAQGTMVELRKKTDGASAPDADPREYVVGIELLTRDEATPSEVRKPTGGGETANPKPQEPKAADGEKAKETESAAGLRAIVTSYRYFDDITVFSTIDLDTGRVVHVEAAQHLRTPLSQSEFEQAQEMAREKSDEVKRLYDHYRDGVSVYPQFSQFTVKDDPRIHRVVHLNYRVGKRDLSFPRPQVDLTTRQVETPPAPPADLVPRPRRPSR